MSSSGLLAAGTLTVSLGLVPVIAAQSLPEVAARERGRRASQTTDEVPSYTDEDLERLRKTVPKQEEGSAAAEAAPGPGTPGETADPTDRATIARWQARAQADRDAIAAIEAGIAAAEQRIGVLRAGGGARPLNEVNRERGIQQDIAAALEQIEQARNELDVARERLDQTLEDARRAGVAGHLLEQPPPAEAPGEDPSRGEY